MDLHKIKARHSLKYTTRTILNTDIREYGKNNNFLGMNKSLSSSFLKTV